MRLPGGMIALELKGGDDEGSLHGRRTPGHPRRQPGGLRDPGRTPRLHDPRTHTRDERALHGISEGLVRLSIGLETPEDIAADLMQALTTV